jgi:hypothetical protein
MSTAPIALVLACGFHRWLKELECCARDRVAHRLGLVELGGGERPVVEKDEDLPCLCGIRVAELSGQLSDGPLKPGSVIVDGDAHGMRGVRVLRGGVDEVAAAEARGIRRVANQVEQRPEGLLRTSPVRTPSTAWRRSASVARRYASTSDSFVGK